MGRKKKTVMKIFTLQLHIVPKPFSFFTENDFEKEKIKKNEVLKKQIVCLKCLCKKTFWGQKKIQNNVYDRTLFFAKRYHTVIRETKTFSSKYCCTKKVTGKLGLYWRVAISF